MHLHPFRHLAGKVGDFQWLSILPRDLQSSDRLDSPKSTAALPPNCRPRIYWPAETFKWKKNLLRENAAAFHRIFLLVQRVQGSLRTLVAAATAAGVPFERDGPGQTGTFPSLRTGKKGLYHSEAIGHRVHRRPSDLSRAFRP